MTSQINNGSFTAKQDAVALALASGQSVRQAALTCKVGERTIHRWQATLPAFAARVRHLRSSLFEEALGKLAAAQVKAASVLTDLLDSENENIRRQTSRDLCSLGLRAHEVHDLAAEVADLRSLVEKSPSHA